MLPEPKLTLPRPRHQLLLLLTKVPAAQSQGKEIVLVELVEDLLPHLRRELVQTLGVIDLPRLFRRLAPGPGARGRRSLSLRHLPLLSATRRPRSQGSLARDGVAYLASAVSRPRREGRRRALAVAKASIPPAKSGTEKRRERYEIGESEKQGRRVRKKENSITIKYSKVLLIITVIVTVIIRLVIMLGTTILLQPLSY